jgi:cation:H+ antiporter
VLAARKGESDLAVGNIVGSNVFNLLFVLGLTAAIRPVPIPDGGHVDLVVMLAFAGALLLLSLGRKRIARIEGSLLLAAYVAYVAWRAI